MLFVMRQAPAFARVMKGAQQSKAGAVVHKARARSPRQLIKIIAPIRNSLAKVLFGQIIALQYPARFKLNSSQRRPPLKSRAFIQRAIKVDEALGICGRVVRVNVDDLVPWTGSGRLMARN